MSSENIFNVGDNIDASMLTVERVERIRQFAVDKSSLPDGKAWTAWDAITLPTAEQLIAAGDGTEALKAHLVAIAERITGKIEGTGVVVPQGWGYLDVDGQPSGDYVEDNPSSDWYHGGQAWHQQMQEQYTTVFHGAGTSHRNQFLAKLNNELELMALKACLLTITSVSYVAEVDANGGAVTHQIQDSKEHAQALVNNLFTGPTPEDYGRTIDLAQIQYSINFQKVRSLYQGLVTKMANLAGGLGDMEKRVMDAQSLYLIKKNNALVDFHAGAFGATVAGKGAFVKQRIDGVYVDAVDDQLQEEASFNAAVKEITDELDRLHGALSDANDPSSAKFIGEYDSIKSQLNSDAGQAKSNLISSFNQAKANALSRKDQDFDVQLQRRSGAYETFNDVGDDASPGLINLKLALKNDYYIGLEDIAFSTSSGSTGWYELIASSMSDSLEDPSAPAEGEEMLLTAALVFDFTSVDLAIPENEETVESTMSTLFSNIDPDARLLVDTIDYVVRSEESVTDSMTIKSNLASDSQRNLLSDEKFDELVQIRRAVHVTEMEYKAAIDAAEQLGDGATEVQMQEAEQEVLDKRTLHLQARIGDAVFVQERINAQLAAVETSIPSVDDFSVPSV